MSSLLLFLLCAAPSTAWADTPPASTPDSTVDAPAASVDPQVASVVEAVQKKYENVEVIQADFVQTKKSEYYGDVDSKGSMVLQRPRKMRWDFRAEDGKSPGTQFVTDGQVMWVYNPEEKQVLRYKEVPSTAADELLQSLHKVGDLFDVALLDTTVADGKRLSLSPKDETLKAQVKNVELQLDPALELHHVVIIDAFDSVTKLTFTNLRLGGTVDDATFRFTIPDGVDVVDFNAG